MVRMTFIISCILMCTFTAAGNAQKVSVNVRKGSLEDVFRQLTRQSDVQIVYNPFYAEKIAVSNARYDSEEIGDVLESVLTDTDLTYELVDGIYIIVEKVFSPQAQQTAGRVTGRVLDRNGSPLPGAAVVIKGTARGTAADAQGRFEMDNISEPRITLMISFLGKQTQEMTVNLNSDTVIRLDDDTADIEEVVVTGYQTISKERAAGSFSTINASDWEDRRIVTVDNFLEGQVAGFNNGVLRGTTSFYAGTQPLYVVDGFPIEAARYSATGSLQEALPDLNMDDVESITTLKDAAATSIYGARAANGVVVIVTRKAKPNQTNVNFSTDFTITPYKYYTGNLASSSMVVDLERELVAKNPAFGTSTTAQDYLDKAAYTSQGMKALLNHYAGNIDEDRMNEILDGLSAGGYKYYRDLEKHAKRNSFTQQYNVSLNHGTNRSSTNVSFTYINDQLSDKHSDKQNFGGNITTSVRFTEWLTLDFGTYFNFKKGTEQTYDPLSSYAGYPYSVYDRLINDDGTPYTVLSSDRRTLAQNNTIERYGLYSMDVTPLDEIGMNLAHTRDFSNRSYARVNVRFTDYLRYSASFQYEYGNYRYSKLSDPESYSVRSLVNTFATAVSTTSDNVNYLLPYGYIYNTTNSLSNGYNLRQQIDFDKTFGGVHNVTALAGFEMRHMKVSYDGVTRYNYDPEMLSYSAVNEELLSVYYNKGVLLQGSIPKSTIRELINRYVSVYGNVAYSYDNRYIITGSLRWDRSNLWGTSSEYQDKPTWSVGGAWNIDREEFFGVSWVDMLKLRLSYGVGGNIARDASPYLIASYYNNTNVGGQYATISAQPNPLLSWEKTATLNIGTDFALFSGRLSGSLDYYRKRGTQLLSNTMGNPTEGFGFSTMKINNGEMTNNGFEAVVAGQIIKQRDFAWNASLVFAYNKNNVTQATAKAPATYLQLDHANAYPRVGDPYNSLYGYKWAGLSNEGIPQIYDSEGNVTSKAPSDFESIVYLGTKIPTYNGSVNMDFRYKNLTLSFMLLYEGGHKIRNSFRPVLSTAYASAASGYIPMTNGAINKDIDKRWREPGDEAHTDIPRLMYTIADYRLFDESIYTNASINAIKGDHLRLRNITLGYRLPEHICRKIYLQNARVNFSVENLFMIASNKTAKYLLDGYIQPSYVLGLNFSF